MERHPYIGLRATSRGISGVVAHVGTASQELSDGVVEHFSGAVLLLADGSHRLVDLSGLDVDPTEAAARLAPVRVDRWQTYRTYDNMHLDDHFVKTGAPEGFEPVGIWEPVSAGHLPALPGAVASVECDLWKRPLRRIQP